MFKKEIVFQKGPSAQAVLWKKYTKRTSASKLGVALLCQELLVKQAEPATQAQKHLPIGVGG